MPAIRFLPAPRYPIHLLSLGAGVQSSTLALMARENLIAPMPLAAGFADTQDEPEAVYAWLQWLIGHLPFPVHVMTEGRLSTNLLTFKTHADGRRFNKTGVPWFTRNADGSDGKIKHRKCTKDFKIVPLNKWARRMIGREAMVAWRQKHAAALKALSLWKKAAKAARLAKVTEPIRPHWAWAECQADPLAIQWVGISLDEINRMKENRLPFLVTRWPLIEQRMTRHDCLLWMKKRGYPEPPRSACIFCPFRNDHEWRRMRTESPADFQRAVEFERELHRQREGSWILKSKPFVHRSLVPLDKVDFSTEEDRGQFSLFDEECEGTCGV